MKISVKILFGLVMVLYNTDAATLSKSYNLSSNVISYILSLHNDLRSSVTKGTFQGQPPSSDMQTLTWDPTMAAYAQSNVNKCSFTHSDLVIPGYENLMVSENMAGGIPGASTIEDEDLKASFLVQFSMKDYDTWMNEVKYFTYPSTCQDGKVCGHYTNLVTSNSNKLGCGIAKCNGMDGDWQVPSNQSVYLMMCDFAGNWPEIDWSSIQPGVEVSLDVPPYKTGNPCSGCAQIANKCSTAGLCTA